MKTSSLRKGFTLVEIMIVVVIIGLLAALAIPAFKKVRNNAIEKTLINDARQIVSAAQQYMSENAATSASIADIAKFISGGKLSSGVQYSKAAATATAPSVSGATLTSTSDTIVQGQYFALGHPNFDAGLSSKAEITAAAGATSGTNATWISFSCDSGAPAK